MKNIRKPFAVALTVALLAFPLSSALAQTSTADTQVMVATTTTTALETPELQAATAAVVAYEVAPFTTLIEIATAEGLKEAADTAIALVVAVGDEGAKAALELRVANQKVIIETAKAPLQAEAEAEAAVAAYEAAPITTLDEVALAEVLKATATAEVEAVVDPTKNAAFILRITNQTAKLDLATIELKAEAAVAAYEAASIKTLAEVALAKGLITVADTAVEAVVDPLKNAALKLRITEQTALIAAAEVLLNAEVIDEDGDEITSTTWFKELINKLQLALAFDPARKGELYKRQALSELALANKLLKDGNIEASEVYLNKFTDKIAKAQAFLLEVEDPTSETAITLAKALVNVEANNIIVLGNLVDKLPPQAAQRLALNVVRTMEKAVDKLQKEEAKVALEVTPVVTPEITVKTEKKQLEKQVKVALAEFKKDINKKGKLYIEDQDLDEDKDQDNNTIKQSKPEQEKSEMDRDSSQVNKNRTNQVMVVPVKTQTDRTAQPEPNFRASENNKDDRNKQEDSKKDKGEDKRQDHR